MSYVLTHVLHFRVPTNMENPAFIAFLVLFSSLSAPEKILPPTLLGEYVLPLVKKCNTFVTQEEVKPKEK